MLTALLLLMLLVVLFRLDRQSLAHSLRQVPLWVALLLVALQVATQLLVNLQWHQIAKHTGPPISFRAMFFINCSGAVVDAITPGAKIGGDVTRALQIRKVAGCSGQQAAAVVALQKLFSISALFFVQLFTLGHLPLFGGRLWQLAIYAVLLLFLAAFLGVFFMPSRIKARLQRRSLSRFLWVRKTQSFLLATLDHAKTISGSASGWATLTLLSVFIWLLYPAKLYILALQLNPGVGPAQIGAVAFAPYMVAMLPIFPGGLGGFEGALSGLLIALGFDISSAAVVTILFRFVTFWFVLLLSLCFVAFGNALKRQLS